MRSGVLYTPGGVRWWESEWQSKV